MNHEAFYCGGVSAKLPQKRLHFFQTGMQQRIENASFFCFAVLPIFTGAVSSQNCKSCSCCGGCSSLSDKNIAVCYTVLQLYKFTSERDPQLNQFLLDFSSTNSVRGGIPALLIRLPSAFFKISFFCTNFSHYFVNAAGL